MQTHEVPRGSLVVGVDGSPESDAAVRWATFEGERRGLAVHLLRAPDHGKAIRSLISASAVAEAVVIGCSGAGAIQRALMGSVEVQLAADAHCPVVVVRTPVQQAAPNAPVVVGVDEGEGLTGVLEYAFREASSRGVPLVAVHAVDREPDAPTGGQEEANADDDPAGAYTILEQALAGLVEMYSEVEVRPLTVSTSAVEALIGQSENACLLVIGTRGRRPRGGFLLGPVSSAAVRHASCPVVVIRTPQGRTDATSGEATVAGARAI
ncbi:universal stress protein [Luteipulveratus mongoliensis]|uniref:universal stress protein n=1 Tax=Luteipulveratus mongoliensis TaxID=571913 RepID=UPI0006970A35|nr:universal stress protein [Luteipulveratus mongoliensis]